MSPGKMYKHIHNTDVAIQVLGYPVHDLRDKVAKVWVKWFNIVNKDHVFEIEGCSELVTIKEDDIKHWKEYEVRQ